MTLPTQPTPSPSQPAASPEVQPASGLYGTPQAAINSVSEAYHYWTGKLTEGSFALSLAVIGANWAVFGSVDKVLNNMCAELSIAAVILSLVVSLIGGGWLGHLLRKRVEYAERDYKRWEKEFNDNVGKLTHWPSTQMIDHLAGALRVTKIWLPVIGGTLFLIALFVPPKALKDQLRSSLSPSPTPAALSAPSPFRSPTRR